MSGCSARAGGARAPGARPGRNGGARPTPALPPPHAESRSPIPSGFDGPHRHRIRRHGPAGCHCHRWAAEVSWRADANGARCVWPWILFRLTSARWSLFPTALATAPTVSRRKIHMTRRGRRPISVFRPAGAGAIGAAGPGRPVCAASQCCHIARLNACTFRRSD